MVLAKRDLLQVNATIIAGLLILLTIQATNVTFLEYYSDYQANQNKISALEKLANESSENVLKEKTLARIADLKIQQVEITEDAGFQTFVNFDPMIFFLITLIPFIGSCIWEIHQADKWLIDDSSKAGRIFTYSGFVILFLSTLILVSIKFLF